MEPQQPAAVPPGGGLQLLTVDAARPLGCGLRLETVLPVAMVIPYPPVQAHPLDCGLLQRKE